MTDPVSVAILGKLLEELNECGSAAARCLIQGVDGSEPVTGKPNKTWLEDEIADVFAGFSMAMEHFDLDVDRIVARQVAKSDHLGRWHALLRGGKHAR